jgi:DNA-binding NarL/FixJ family response regulator
VLLDLRLADGSSPAVNVRRLIDAGYLVIAFTSGESAYLTRLAIKAGVAGVLRKSERIGSVIAALEGAARGASVITAEWAHAVESDPHLPDARLSDQEARILTMFADGAKAHTVASTVGITVGTLEDYVRRIRVKYAKVGRPAYTKVDLYKRAVEDGLLPGPSHS